MKYKLFSLIIVCIIPLFIFIGCTDNSDSYGLDDNGIITTNDVDKLGEITPFEIITPRYIPEELKSCNVMYTKGLVSGDTDNVRIGFYYIKDQYILDVQQESYANWVADDDFDITILMVNGIQITQEKFTNYWEDGDTEIPVIAYHYYWNNNDSTCFVTIQGYDESQSQKIIKSML